MVKETTNIKILTPDEKLNLSLDLYWSVWELKKAALKNEFPDLSDAELETKVKEIFIYAST
ncbi:MAG: hypothetical protein C0412_05195 [Flavobacterium sp.]|nr:hypothetical protein [Flavobacterium sp.]